MANFEIPLIAQNQRFVVALSGVQYQMNLTWNTYGNSWILDIADQNGVPVANGIPLVTGGDLLAALTYLGFGGQLIVFTDDNPDAPPTYANLGSVSHLYYVTP